MPSTNPNAISKASNPDYVDNGLDKGDMSGRAAQRTSAAAKALEGAATEPDFDARQAAKAILSRGV